MNDNDKSLPASSSVSKTARGGLQAISSLVPFAGGLLSAAAGAWSENEQEKVNSFLHEWLKMIEDEIKEKEITIMEIVARLDMHDKEISKRMKSSGYQSLLRKTFREWSGAESEQKRHYIRNILANAAATSIASDDVVKLFMDWLKNYSELHFQVIGAIYNSGGISRGEIWTKIGKESVREDSADADLYKLLFRDLSNGGIIRQHREKTFDGRFLKEIPKRRLHGYIASREIKSAFDTAEKYELTELGLQFIHYAMTDLPLKIEYNSKNNKK